MGYAEARWLYKGLVDQGALLMDLDEEQKKIIELVENALGGRIWGKYTGDVCCRIIKKHIENHVPKGLRVVGPNAYLEGNPVEFDLLIVDANAPPTEYTNMYPMSCVHCVIEIKKSGLFGGRQELEKKTRTMREKFLLITEKKPEVRCAYLTINEVTHPKRKGSIDYFEETKKGLSSFEAFMLREHRTGQITEGEWKRFIDYLFVK